MTVEGPRSLTGRTVRGMAWMTGGMAAQALTKVAVLAFLARRLTQAEFGLVAEVLVVVGLADFAAQLGIGRAIVQRRELTEGHLRTGLALSGALGLVWWGAMVASADATASFFASPELAPVLIAMAPTTAARAIVVPLHGKMARELRFATLARIQVVAFVLGYGVTGIGMGWRGFGLWALVGAYWGQLVVELVAYTALARYPLRPHLRRREARELLAFGVGETGASFLQALAQQADKAIIGRVMGPAALGVYTRAYELLLMPTALFGRAALQVLMPVLSTIQDQPARIGQAWLRSSALLALAVFPMAAATVVLAPEVVRVLYGPGWEDVITPLRILGAAMFLRAAFALTGSVTRACGAVWQEAWRQAVYVVGLGAAAAAGIRWGLPGVTTAVAGALLLQNALMVRLCLRLTHLDGGAWIRGHLPAIALGLAVGAGSGLAAAPMRDADLPAVIVLVCAGLAGLAGGAGGALLAPRAFLGAEGTRGVRLVAARWERRGAERQGGQGPQ